MEAEEGVVEEVRVVKVVEVDTITMADMDMETATGTIAVRRKAVVHRDGLLVASSAVSSAAFSVSFSVKMERARDAVSAVNRKGSDHTIKTL